MKASKVRLSSCVRFEFSRGIVSIVPFLAALAACACATQIAFSIEAHNAGIDGFRSVDALAYVFRGMEVFRPESKLPFIVDAYWIVPRLLIGYIACFIPVRDLKGYSLQVVTRCGSRTGWISAKLLLGTSAVVFYYIVCALFAWANALVWGGFDPATNHIRPLFLGIDPRASDISTCLALVLSLVADLSLVPLCMALALVFGAIVSFVSLVALLILSAFFANPYFWVNGTMLARSFLASSGGLDAEAIAFACAFVLALGIACCYLVGKKVEYR